MDGIKGFLKRMIRASKAKRISITPISIYIKKGDLESFMLG